MEDVVGVIVSDRERGRLGFLTWGRLWNAVDEELLAKKLMEPLRREGLKQIEYVRVCYSLRELTSAPYFYEGLLHFARKPPKFGKHYGIWKRKARKRVLEARDLYLIGELGPQDLEDRLATVSGREPELSSGHSVGAEQFD